MAMNTHNIDPQMVRGVISSLGFPADRVERAVVLLLGDKTDQATVDSSRLMSSREVQRLLAVSKSTLRRMISRGELKPLKITPRRMGFRADEVSAFVGSLARHTPPVPAHTKNNQAPATKP